MEHPSPPLLAFLGTTSSQLRRLHGVLKRGDPTSEWHADARLTHEISKAPAPTMSPMVHAILAAADRASTSLADATNEEVGDVRREFNELIAWLIGTISADGNTAIVTPPIAPRDYVTSFRTHLLAELAVTPGLNAREVVSALMNVDRATEAWKQTDRGRFILRLTGSHSVDAVVAIAHDLRSPLCSILLLVDALRHRQHSVADPGRDRYLGLIYDATLGLSTTVNNLILAGRGARLGASQAMPFSVAEIMSSVSAIVQPICEEKGIPLDIECPKMDARIGHASVVHQALLNLASNAVRHTDSGSVTMGCTELPRNNVEFWVEDTGPGIPDEVLERFCYGFAPEDVAQGFSGAGLGLAIVRALVEAMGSTLQVDTGSEGTRFCFLLELPASPEAAGEARTSLPATTGSDRESLSSLLPV